jgi:predicted flap endonuclease-1-like 5' DNA nuclease
MFENMNPMDKSTAMIEIIIMIAGAVILGFLVGWLIRKLQKDKLKADLRLLQDRHQSLLHKTDESIRDHLDLQRQVDDLRQRKDALLNEMDAMRKENAIMEEKLGQLESSDTGERDTEVQALRNEIERLKAKAPVDDEVRALKEQLTSSEADRGSMKEELAALRVAARTDDEIAPLKDLIDALEKEKRDLLEKIENTGNGAHKTEEIERLKSTVARANEEKEELRSKLQSLTESLPGQGEWDSMQARLVELDTENSQLREKLASASSDEEEPGATNTALADQVTALLKKNRELEEEKQELEEQLDEGVQKITDPKEIADLKLAVKALESEKESLQAALKKRMSSTVATEQFTGLEKKVEALERELEPVVSSETEHVVNGENGHQTDDTARESDAQRTVAEGKDSSPDEPRDTTLSSKDYKARKKALIKNVGRAQESDKDILSKIVGVGPFIEAKLNSIGIYTYEQISRFNEEDADHVTRLIEFFPGRIERDGWVRQAKKLLKKKEEV